MDQFEQKFYFYGVGKKPFVLIFSMNTFCALVLCTAALFPYTKGKEKKQTMKPAAKCNDNFGDCVLAEYLFKRGDVNKDGVLTKNEIYNFYRHDINWPIDQAQNMSITLIKIGDVNNDQKLDEQEAVLALSRVTDKLTKKRTKY